MDVCVGRLLAGFVAGPAVAWAFMLGMIRLGQPVHQDTVFIVWAATTAIVLLVIACYEHWRPKAHR